MTSSNAYNRGSSARSARQSIAAAALIGGMLIFASPALHAQSQEGVSNEAASPTDEHAFIAENNVAMARMMAGVAVPSNGDVDRNFVAMMVPHQQGAIDMAIVELRHGKNEKLRRIAQEVIVTQKDEIRAMQSPIGATITQRRWPPD